MPFRGVLRRASAAVCLFLVLSPEARTEPAAPRVRVTAATANVRSDPSLKGAVLFQAKRGDELILLGESADWYHVRDAAGAEGYLRIDLAEPIAAPNPPPASLAAPAAAPSTH